MGAAGDSLSQSAAIAQDKFAAVEGDVEARIKKNPWRAVAIAALSTSNTRPRGPRRD